MSHCKIPCVFVSHNVTKVKYVQQYHQSMSQNTYWYVPSYLVSFLQNFNHMLVSSFVFFSASLKFHNSKKHVTTKNATLLYIYLQYQYITIVYIYIYFYQTTRTIIHFITIKPLSSIQFWYVVLHIFER